MQKFNTSTFGYLQKRVVFVEMTEAGERLFWQKPGTQSRRDTESSIKVRVVAGGVEVGGLGRKGSVWDRKSGVVRACRPRGSDCFCMVPLPIRLLQISEVHSVSAGQSTDLLRKKGKPAKADLYFSLHTPARELCFEATSPAQRDWLVAGFKAIMRV